MLVYGAMTNDYRLTVVMMFISSTLVALHNESVKIISPLCLSRESGVDYKYPQNCIHFL